MIDVQAFTARLTEPCFVLLADRDGVSFRMISALHPFSLLANIKR